jgi:cephalosporin hydroxylase
VLSIDVSPRSTVFHERIEYLNGSSTAEPVIAAVRARINLLDAKRLLFVLDSDHRAAHVRAELDAYAPLVPVGCYLHVQDGLLDYLPRFSLVAARTRGSRCGVPRPNTPNSNGTSSWRAAT